jgi:hypothetical protein
MPDLRPADILRTKQCGLLTTITQGITENRHETAHHPLPFVSIRHMDKISFILQDQHAHLNPSSSGGALPSVLNIADRFSIRKHAEAHPRKHALAFAIPLYIYFLPNKQPDGSKKHV